MAKGTAQGRRQVVARLRDGRFLAGWLGTRHSLRMEAAAVLGLYAVYQTTRGLVAGDRPAAVSHARMIASFERSLHVFVEARVQHAASGLPGLLGVLGLLYLTLHLAVTGGHLVWLHARRPAAFPRVRTALLAASALALIGFLTFPTAPPRLAGLGISDTISNGRVDLDHGLIGSLYNPYAAFPSVHIAYAVIVGASLVRHSAGAVARALGVVYPVLVLFVILATGNHFVLDAFAGAVVAAIGAAAGVALSKRVPAQVDVANGNAVARRRSPDGGRVARPGYRVRARRSTEIHPTRRET